MVRDVVVVVVISDVVVALLGVGESDELLNVRI